MAKSSKNARNSATLADPVSNDAVEMHAESSASTTASESTVSTESQATSDAPQATSDAPQATSDAPQATSDAPQATSDATPPPPELADALPEDMSQLTMLQPGETLTVTLTAPANANWSNSESGAPWYEADLPLGSVLSIPELNPQREDFTHLDKAEGRNLITSMADNGFQRNKERPSAEQYNEVAHGKLWEKALGEHLAELRARVARAVDAKLDKEIIDACEEAVKYFLSVWQVPQVLSPDLTTVVTPAQWHKPKYIVVGGNTRWLVIFIASGTRIVNKLDPIDTFPCFVFAAPLTEEERDREQILENQPEDSATKPSTIATIRAMRRQVARHTKYNPEHPNDIFRADCPVDQKRFKRLLFGDRKPTSSIDGRAMANHLATIRPAIALDTLFPKLRLLDRVGASGPIDGMPPLVYSTAFTGAKAAPCTEAAYRAVLDDRIAENDRRAALAGRANEKFIRESDAEHSARLQAARATGTFTPFGGSNKFLALTSISEQEVSRIISGDVVKPAQIKETLKEARTEITKASGEESTTAKQIAESLSEITQGGSATALTDLTARIAPVMDLVSKIESDYKPVQWLSAIQKIAKVDQPAIMSVLESPATAGRLAEVAKCSDPQWHAITKIINLDMESDLFRLIGECLSAHPKDVSKALKAVQRINGTLPPAAPKAQSDVASDDPQNESELDDSHADGWQSVETSTETIVSNGASDGAQS